MVRFKSNCRRAIDVNLIVKDQLLVAVIEAKVPTGEKIQAY
jgi:hypothetical protein